MRAAKAESERVATLFAACCAALVDEGWSNEDLAEMKACVKADFSEGAGVPRPFEMLLAERRTCWINWFAEVAGAQGSAAEGVNIRLREQIKREKMARNQP